MKKWLLHPLLFLCFSTFLNAQTLPLTQFGGLDTDNDPLFVQDGMTPDAENVNTDDALGIAPRMGYVRFSTESSKKLWEHVNTDGTRYIITFSSNNIKASYGFSSFSANIGTMTLGYVPCATSLGNKFFISSSSDGLKYWDSNFSTNTFVTVSTGLRFTQLVTHKGRLWGCGIPGDEKTIYVSKLYDGTDWDIVIDPSDDDPARITVQGSLDESLTLLYASFRDILIWGKPNSFGGVYGSRRSTFQSRSFSEKIGTAYPESVQDCDGMLRFMGPRRTVYEFDGQNVKKISETIDILWSSIQQGDTTRRAWVQTSANDWNSGSFTGSGNVGVYISSSISDGDLVLLQKGNPNDDFQDHDLSSGPQWTIEQGSPTFDNGFLTHNDAYGNINIRTNSTVTIATWTITQFDVYTTGYDFMENSGGKEYILSIDNGASYKEISIKNNTTTIISAQLPTTTSTNFMNRFRVVRNAESRFFLYYFLDCDNPSKTETFVGSAYNNYFGDSDYFRIRGPQYDMKIASVTVTQSGQAGNNADWTSINFNVGNKITAWGPFNISQTLNGGSITYLIGAGNTDTDQTQSANRQTVTNNLIPSISTGSYMTVRASFARTLSSFTPTLHEMSVSWYEGSVLRVASVYFGQKYWLGVAISTTSNNKVLVYNKRNQWDRYSGINMDAAIVYGGGLMFGNPGGIFEAEQGHTDNGVAINAYYTYKTIVPSAIHTMSTYRDLHMITSRSNAALQTTYYVDGINTPYSLPSYNMDTQEGYQHFHLPFQDTLPQKSRTIAVKWTVSSTLNWRILGGILDYYPDPVTTTE